MLQYFQGILGLDSFSPTLVPKEGPHYFGYQPILSDDTVGQLEKNNNKTLGTEWI